MKPLVLSLALAGHLWAGTELITLGDSLTFAYEAEFGFQFTVPLGETYGDGMNPAEVKNWAEILHQNRSEHFDLGSRSSLEVPLGPFSYELFLRQENNWAIPGLKIDQLRRFMTSDAGFLELLAESPDFGPLATLFDFAEVDFAIGDLEDQISSSDGRLVFFIGGNDADSIYGAAYEGESTGSFVADFLDDAAVIIDRIQELNPTLPIVLVNVPHVGITPMVKDSHPTDPVKTARATALLRELNQGLATLARSRDLAYADIFSTTLPLLSDAPLSVYGVPFFNSGSTTGDLDSVWLDGPYSMNFHPNTSAQALIANEIVCAFNQRYQTGIPELSASEVLTELLGKNASEVDMNFEAWSTSYSLSGISEQDDGDQDGLPAGLEFALGLNPLLQDGKKLTCQETSSNGQSYLEIAYPVRLPESSHVSVVPTATDTLGNDFEVLDPLPEQDEDGLYRALIPLKGPSGFLRLETVAPEE